MWRFVVISLCALFVCSSLGDAFAQELPDRRVGFTFLLLPTGARDEALGATGVASVGTASTMMYNPAGLAFIHRMDVNYSYINWYGNARKHVTCIAGRASKAGTFGVSLQNFGYGSSTTADVKDFAVTAAWGSGGCRPVCAGRRRPGDPGTPTQTGPTMSSRLISAHSSPLSHAVRSSRWARET